MNHPNGLAGTGCRDERSAGERCPLWQEVARWMQHGESEAAEPGSDMADGLAEHLERCADCQCCLEAAVAADPWWLAAAECLAQDEPDLSELRMAIPAVAAEIEASGALPNGEHAAKTVTDFPPGLLQPPSHPELLGRLGRYEIERLIGQGGMGLVFRAFDPQLHRVVAVKLLAPQLAASTTARERFAREARAVAGLAHPHLIAIHDVVSTGPLPYLVMTYIDGISLEQLVRSDGPLPIEQAIQLARQLVSGLAAAHDAGLIHRDIKPGNILCTAAGQRAVLTDFGLVRALDDATLTHSGILAGTPHYMAPEQARGGQAGPRSDLWAVGAVLYFALTGRPPFEAEHPVAVLHQVCSAQPPSLQTLRPDVWPELVSIVERLLRKSPASRYRDCDSLRSELDQLARSGPGRWRMLRCRHRRWTRNGVALSVAAGLVLLIVTIARRSSEPVVGGAPVGPAAEMHQADTRWREALSELDQQSRELGQSLVQVDPNTPTAPSPFEFEISHLIGQLEQLEQATGLTAVSSRDSSPPPITPFSAQSTALLELLHQLPADEGISGL